MAQLACNYSDKVIFTSDNPRFEDPSEILKDMEAGLDSAAKRKYISIVDRREAIKLAVSFANKEDIIFTRRKRTRKIPGNSRQARTI